MKKRWMVSALAACAVCVTTTTAFAQAANTSSPAPASDASAAPGGVTRTASGHYASTEVMEIHGEIQRPYAFTLSGRSSLGYSFLEVPVHFVQEILESVRRAPF